MSNNFDNIEGTIQQQQQQQQPCFSNYTDIFKNYSYNNNNLICPTTLTTSALQHQQQKQPYIAKYTGSNNFIDQLH